MADNPIHPALRAGVRFLPRLDVSPWTKGLLRILVPLGTPGGRVPGISLRVANVPTTGTPRTLQARIHRPDNAATTTPALLWIHGGGHVLGTAAMDDFLCAGYARDLGITVIAPNYRLAPENPFPADLDDCHATLAWMAQAHRELGIDPARIAVGGLSAGGGLAAALAQRALDQGPVVPCFQLLNYPMLDDRTAVRTDINERGFKLWHQGSNRYAWRAYLGVPPGSDSLPDYAVPARRENHAGLPPAWLGVGTLDLFHDEGRAYARRLQACGVACETMFVEGAYHGFDVWSARAEPSVRFRQSHIQALRRALFPGS